MADIGYLSLLVAFFLSVYALIGYTIGIKSDNQRLLQSAKGAVASMAILVSLASLILMVLLLTSDFSIKYVAEYTSRDLSWFYKITALWAGNAGSLLLWIWILAIYTAIVAYANKIPRMTPYASAILSGISIFFLFILAFIINPFESLPYPPAEGQGLNPLLQNPGMVIHPVTLYLGYVGFAVPYAFAMTALYLRDAGDKWIKVTRNWTITAWLFLTLGNLFGAQWAYVELGWGGFWAWDPVENASFIPWLTGTAFLHSVMIQERKNMLKMWNMLLVIITFVLTLFGTYLVRSGVLSSVHSFSQNPVFGMIFLSFTLFALVASLWLMISRMNMLKENKEFESYISKESSFLANNLILLGIAFATFWGTIFPIISEVVRGVKLTVGQPFFNKVNAPLGLALLLLMGICPLIAWRKASMKNLINNFAIPAAIALLFAVAMLIFGFKHYYGLAAFTIAAFMISSTMQDVIKGLLVRMKMTGENLLVAFGRLTIRNRRRYGGYIIHLGLVAMMIGIIGYYSYNQEITKTLRSGETISIGKYIITFNNLNQRKNGLNNDEVYADLSVITKNGDSFTIQPSKIFYPTHDSPSTEVAIHGSLQEDLYIILAAWEQDGRASFKVLINPLMAWLWIGGYMMILGTIFALWPGRGSDVGPKYIQTQESKIHA